MSDRRPVPFVASVVVRLTHAELTSLQYLAALHGCRVQRIAEILLGHAVQQSGRVGVVAAVVGEQVE